MSVKKRTTKPGQIGPERIIITDEKTAWEVLERALTVGMKGDVDLCFDGWPVFRVNVKGKDWHSTVPTRVMIPLLDVQREINRAYASIRYGTSNSRRLKHDERDELEVVVKVTEGSSLYDAELWTHFSAMAQAAVGRMNGTQIVVVVLGTAAMVAGTVLGQAWLAQRRQEKELDHNRQMSQEDTRRLELFTQALARQPSLVSIQQGVQAAHNEFLKVVKPGDTITLGEEAVTAQEAAALVQTERERAQEARFEGEFLVLGNRTDKSEGFRITVQRLSDKLTLNAEVPVELPYGQQKMIQEAEWKKKRIALSIDAVMLRDSISQATVISASAPRERE